MKNKSSQWHNPYNCPATINVENNVIATKLLFIQLGSTLITIFEISSLLFSTACTPGLYEPFTKRIASIVMLQVADRLWPVKLYSYLCAGAAYQFSSGWPAFVRENTLQLGDVCIFEFVMMRDDVVFQSSHFQMPGISGYLYRDGSSLELIYFVTKCSQSFLSSCCWIGVDHGCDFCCI